jgi:hypothetical protein
VIDNDLQDNGHYDAAMRSIIRQHNKTILMSLNAVSPSPPIVEAAISALDSLILEYPFHAGSYINRAEARRLLYPETEILVSHPEVVVAIFEDLGQAISLTLAKPHQQVVSRQSATVLASAYTHRALLLYRSSQMPYKRRQMLFSMKPELMELTEDAILELASRDFAMGGRYGNKLAKQMAVLTNPYAKLCGNIVKEALRKEIDMSACDISAA